MYNFPHTVLLSESAIRRQPWLWLEEKIGRDGEDWILRYQMEPGIVPNAFLCFRTKEHAVLFTLSWI
jgi:hypothetical protein